jgi:hypothetical protein
MCYIRDSSLARKQWDQEMDIASGRHWEQIMQRLIEVKCKEDTYTAKVPCMSKEKKPYHLEKMFGKHSNARRVTETKNIWNHTRIIEEF